MEPTRLNEGDDLGAELLQGVKSYRASAGSRHRTLTALGLVGAPALVAAKVGSAATLGSKLWVLLGAGVLSGGVALVALQARSPDPVESTPPPRTAAAAPSATFVAKEATSAAGESETQANEVQAKEPTDQLEGARRPTSGQPKANRAPKLEAKPTTSGTPRDTLNAELAMLDRARRDVAGGRGARALSTLSEYRQQFPSGRLTLEAEALRIEALDASGKRAQARVEARAFLERHPKSLLAPRVERFAK
jgi:hypothetical protein